MKKNKFFFKQLLSIVLIFVLALTIAVPAIAAAGDTYSITINNNDNLPEMVTGQFTAYQIFKGTLNADEPNNRQLADIGWGNGINEKDFVSALKTDSTIGSYFKDITETTDSEEAANDQAAAVADILVKNNNYKFLQKFSKIASEYLNKDSGFTSALSGKNSVINVDAPGYYLIVENSDKIPGVGNDGKGSGDANKVTSSFILDVLGDQNVTIKADIPSVDKHIVTDSGEVKSDTVNIGDTVKFKLTGKLPSNYGDYTTYYYNFIDTLSKGLSLTYETDNSETHLSLTVSVKNSKSTVEVPADQYTVKVSKTSDGETVLNVEFNDLKVVKDADGNPVEITSASEIVVNYTAIVNENAVSGSEGNPNKVQLEYSNNPNSNETGKTTEKVVVVYDFGLKITKIASDTSKGLNGAEFILSKNVNDTTYYAKFDALAESAENRKLNSWTVNKNDATPLSTDNNGKFNIEGIDEGTYTLTESKTPTGYNTMKSITFTIKATIENDILTGLETTLEGSRPDVTVSGSDIVTGLTPMQLVNQRASTLPFTGGVGTTIIYVLGGVLIAGSAAYLILSGRKKKSK